MNILCRFFWPQTWMITNTAPKTYTLLFGMYVEMNDSKHSDNPPTIARLLASAVSKLLADTRLLARTEVWLLR